MIFLIQIHLISCHQFLVLHVIRIDLELLDRRALANSHLQLARQALQTIHINIIQALEMAISEEARLLTILFVLALPYTLVLKFHLGLSLIYEAYALPIDLGMEAETLHLLLVLSHFGGLLPMLAVLTILHEPVKKVLLLVSVQFGFLI